MSRTGATSSTITRARLNQLRSGDESATALTIGGQTLDVARSPFALLSTSFLLDELGFQVSRVAP